MNGLDIFIILTLLASLIRGLEVGFLRQFFSTVGFFMGLFLGAWLENRLIGLVHSAASKAMLVLVVVLGSAFILMTIGEYVGLRLKLKLREIRVLEKLDRYLGSVLAGVTVLVAIWLAFSIFRAVPAGTWQRQIRGSRIVAAINSEFPSAPDVLTRLGHLINPNGFPQVFSGLEPSLPADVPLPDMGELNPAVAAVRPSVVKIEGEGCGGIVEGSGFVAADHTVVTNAHVVAGVTEPFVIDQTGQHKATAIWFDPDLDIAVLRVNGLSDPPLTIRKDETPKGSPAAVLGYPGGGGFKAGPAAILDAFVARGRNIYNQGDTTRRVYSIKAQIAQGNSGGPMINKDGQVIGVVFARSVSYENIGYALTTDQVLQTLQGASQSNRAVGTGSCAE